MLDDKQICEVVLQYLDSDIYNYTIMIDGKWGCGKTHFISKTLIPTIIEKRKGKEVIYMSLYGIDSTKYLSNKFYMTVAKKIDIKPGKIQKILESGKYIFSKITGYFGINTDNYGELLSVWLDISKCVVIFDDLERCSCGINETLGFINNLVEHSGVKTIIVANQEKLPKVGNNQEYERIKEKVIGTTISYEANLDSVMKSLTEKHIKDEGLKKIILDGLPQMTADVENKKGSKDKDENNDSGISNIRTFQFFLEKINELFVVMKGNCQETHLSIILEEVVTRCFSTCYEHKRGCNEARTEDLFFPDILSEGFVDEFVKNCAKDENKITESIKHYEKILDDQNDPRRKLVNWQFDSDKNVIKHLGELREKIRKKGYEISEYRMILPLFMDILEKVTLYDDNEAEIKGIVDDMCANISDWDNIETFDTSNINMQLDAIADDIPEERKRKYSSHGERLLKALKNIKNSNVINSIDSLLEDEANWGRRVYESYFENKSTRLASIFQYVDTSKIVSLVEKSTNENIYVFQQYLNNLYGAGSVNGFFKDDVLKLRELINGMGKLDPSKFDQIKTLAVKSLRETLERKCNNLTSEESGLSS